MKKIFFVFLLFFLIALIFTSCGNLHETEAVDNDAETENWLERQNEILDILSRFDTANESSDMGVCVEELYADHNVITLRVHGNSQYEIIIRQAEVLFNHSLREKRSDYRLRVNIDSYHIPQSNEAYARLGVELMAGRGPDLIMAMGAPIWDWVPSGLFSNINEIMYHSNTFNRSDFYENVLDAMEYRGALYVLPLSFGFEYIAINNNLPSKFIERFIQYEYISVSQVLAIYADLMASYSAQFTHLRIANTGVLSFLSLMLPYAMAPFVDIQSGTADLTNSGFVEFLYQLQRVYTSDDIGVYSSIGMFPLAGSWQMRDFSNSLAFHVACRGLEPINAFFKPQTRYFYHYIPIVCETGRLRVSYAFGGPTWANILFPATGNSDLAFEFAMFLLEAMVNPQLPSDAILNSWGNWSFSTPIRRDLFADRIPGILEHILTEFPHPYVGVHNEMWEIVENEMEIQIEGVLLRLSELNEMPVTVPPPLGAGAINLDILDQLLRGIIRPNEAAQLFYNQVNLWLMEVR